jgi:hypothetical protein
VVGEGRELIRFEAVHKFYNSGNARVHTWLWRRER